MALMPTSSATAGTSSTSNLIKTASAYFFDNASKMGEMALHGPHHVAKKLM